MKILLFISAFILVCGSVVAQDCEKYKTGSFTTEIDGLGSYSIERTKKFQFEEIAGIVLKFKVEWLDDCSYKLTNANKASKKMFGEQVVYCVIIETGDDYYIAEGWIDDSKKRSKVRIDVAK